MVYKNRKVVSGKIWWNDQCSGMDAFTGTILRGVKMSRYINADELIRLCRIMADKCDSIGETAWNQFADLIKNIPTTDVVPIVHGHWIQSGYACGETDWECSVCHCHEWRTGKTEYCMRCGAKMDEVKE